MANYINFNKSQKNNLYNKLLLLSRKKFFYTNFELNDTFQNRIHLIFIHISFIFIKNKQHSKNDIYKVFYQEMFDLIFKRIELNMREIGYGDVSVNKNMKSLVKSFYDILLNCEKYRVYSNAGKINFLSRYLSNNNIKKKSTNKLIIDYFDKYEAFCFDLTSDSVLKDKFNFNYK